MVRGLCTMVAKTKQLPGITTLASNTEAIIGVGGVRAHARVWVWVGGCVGGGTMMHTSNGHKP